MSAVKEQANPLPRLSHAGECQSCKAWRATLKRVNRTEIYSTRGRVRYCKCLNCGATWKKVF